MKVITEVKWIEVPHDIWEIAHMQRPEFPIRVDTDSGPEAMNAEVVIEHIRGMRLRNPFTGEDIILGVSVQGAEVIGCAYEAFEELQAGVDSYRDTANARAREIAWIRSAGFLTRLKWLFTGVGREL